MIFSAELFDTFKPSVISLSRSTYHEPDSESSFKNLFLFFRNLNPNRNPKAYLQAIHHLSLPPSQCAMVAAHIKDLRAAASVGMKTVYVRRVGEDPIVRDGELVKSKNEGGEVDCVVDSFLELSEIISSVQ